MLSLKKLSPTRLIKNEFYKQVQEAEDRGATPDEMRELLGRGRAKKGIFEGNLVDGELEIGQIVSYLKTLPAAGDVVRTVIEEFNNSAQSLSKLSF
jgi:enoyl-[acyl-carrier protein] reductase II